MKTQRISWVLYSLMLFALLGSSCTPKLLVSPYLNDYKEAQNAFNQAATAENQMRGNPDASLTLSPETSYSTARTFIVKAMGNGENLTKLASDGLLLGAYSIKAMSEWKLGLYSEALKTSRDAQTTFANDQAVRNQRDYIVLGIIEPLIYNDSIATYIQALDGQQSQDAINPTEKSYLATLEKAYTIVEEKRQRLPEDHPLQAYLTVTQLSLAKNWKNLYGKTLQRLRRGRSADYDAWKKDGDASKDALNIKLADAFKRLAEILGGDKHPSYLQWKQAHADVAGI